MRGQKEKNSSRKSKRTLCQDYLRDLNGLLAVSLAAVRPAASLLRRRLSVAVIRLAALLVAELELDPQLPHLAAWQDVRDPLDHKRTGLFLLGRPWRRRRREPGRVLGSDGKRRRHSPTLRKVRSSTGRMGWGPSALYVWADSCLGCV